MYVVLNEDKWQEHLNCLDYLVEIAKKRKLPKEIIEGFEMAVSSVVNASLSQSETDKNVKDLVKKSEVEKSLYDLFEEMSKEQKGERNYLKERLNKYEKTYFYKFIYSDITHTDIFIKDAKVFRVSDVEFMGADASYFPGFKVFVFPTGKIPKYVVLHEMLHFYLDNIGDVAKNYLCAVMALKLRPIFDEFESLLEILTKLSIGVNGEFPIFEGFEEQIENHTMVFLLCSFDLDLQCGFSFGTVFGYGMDIAIKAAQDFIKQTKKKGGKNEN